MKKILVIAVAVVAVALAVWYVPKLYRAKPASRGTPETEIDAGETVKATLNALDASDPQSLLKIQDIIDLGTAAVEPLAPLIDSEDPLEQWTAVVGLAAVRAGLDSQDTVTNLLKQAYGSKFATVALYAAGSNAKYGDYSGLPFVLDALESGEITIFMDPPGPVSEFADAILRHVSGEDYGFSASAEPAEKNRTIAKWRAWWDVFREDKNI